MLHFKPLDFNSSLQDSIQARRLQFKPPGFNPNLEAPIEVFSLWASIQTSKLQFKLQGSVYAFRPHFKLRISDLKPQHSSEARSFKPPCFSLTSRLKAQVRSSALISILKTQVLSLTSELNAQASLILRLLSRLLYHASGLCRNLDQGLNCSLQAWIEAWRFEVKLRDCN